MIKGSKNVGTGLATTDFMGAGVIMPLLLSLIFFGFGFGHKDRRRDAWPPAPSSQGGKGGGFI
jgi:hypothetical protein